MTRSDKPILMQPGMVRATLREIENPGMGKNETRRIIKPQPVIYNYGVYEWWPRYKGFMGTTGNFVDGFINAARHYCPFGRPGDLLWCRETFANWDGGISYKADAHCDETRKAYGIKWKPSIHMPRWANRITLLIKDIRVERVQDITDQDALAEGMQYNHDLEGWHVESARFFSTKSPRHAFAQLWQFINGEQAWHDNPWVWVIENAPYLMNIDDFKRQEAA